MLPDRPSDPNHSQGRRALLQALVGGAGAVASRVLLPALWSAPIVAALELPAHATCSDPKSTVAPLYDSKTCTCARDPKDAICTDTSTTSNTQNTDKTATVTNGVGTFSVITPTELLTTPRPFRLMELVSGGETVIEQFVPTGGSELSKSYAVTLTRATGTYTFLLRWDGGAGAAFKVTF